MEELVSFPWLKIAEAELGTKEVPGKGNSERVLSYHAVTRLHATEDKIPWCASFVSYCLEKAGVRSTKSARALSYEHYGRRLSDPVVGCIAVLKRTGGGHVGFYVGTNLDGKIRLLGGNQSDSVCYANYSPDKVVAYVLPSSY